MVTETEIQKLKEKIRRLEMENRLALDEIADLRTREILRSHGQGAPVAA